MNSEQLWELARRTLLEAQTLGAEESTVVVSRNSEVSLIRRAGRLEQATQATSLSLAVSLLVGDRYSGHSTSDLRPDALRAFLEKAVAATRALEPEPERRQPPRELCGLGTDPKTLDQWDPYWAALTVEQRIREGMVRMTGIPSDRSQILAPVPHPTSCRDGYAFRQHVAAARRNRKVDMIPEFDQYPIFYFTNHNSIQGPGDVLCMPDHFEKLDFELEVAVVINSRRFPSAWAPNKKEAEQRAALLALQELNLAPRDAAV